jgi:beta-glucosidase
MRLPASALLFSVGAVLSSVYALHSGTVGQPELGYRSASLLTVDGVQFKNLNRNRKLDIYEDWRKSSANRGADLVPQMSVEDMAGVMVHGTLPSAGGANASIGMGSGYDFEKSKALIDCKRINTFITRLGGDPANIAESANKLQELAETTRFGIPLTISTDPRNNFLYVPGASVEGGSFSKRPETTGPAAINDPALTRRYAETVRKEYIAVGIREALSPQADLATEPRSARLTGSFGEDADGLDSHNYYGRYSALTDALLPYHIKPFLGAFEAHVAAVMPTYSILLENVHFHGLLTEQVGAGFNKQLLSELLRGTMASRV